MIPNDSRECIECIYSDYHGSQPELPSFDQVRVNRSLCRKAPVALLSAKLTAMGMRDPRNCRPWKNLARFFQRQISCHAKKKNKENTKHVHGCHGFVHCVHFGGHGLGLLVLTHSHVLGVGVLSEPSPTLSQHGWGCITKDPHVVVDQMMDMVSRSVSPNMNGARH